MSVEQLITTGSGVLILSAIVIAFYTSRVITKEAHNGIVDLITKMWQERFDEVVAEKEAWKSQALQLTPAVASIAEELEEANRRDEVWRRAFTEGAVADRRKQTE